MGFGLDLGLGVVALVVWLVSAPVIYRIVRRISESPNAEQRVLVGESLMMLHIVLLIVTIVGFVYTGWDLM